MRRRRREERKMQGRMQEDESVDTACPFLLQLKDLRSQVTREACVTLSFFSVVFAGDFATMAELMMSQLIPLLSNSAKV